MKLIRCYIENFGGLQQYSVEFNEGLTVIHEANGFGKTTLAEFIRAMFYGFPRANKDINKNPRLKYLPWQGGRYGGYLIFEHNGKRYRVDRSFGELPKSDKFKLYHEDTNRECSDFTADLGMELFGLDAESFMRSTYMPQIHDNAPLSTDNIRAKLGNLLEDTGDIGSYESALQRLRDKRTSYEHFRGNGGKINETQRRITQLEQEIIQCRSKQSLLEQTEAMLLPLQQELEGIALQLSTLRKQLQEATTAEAEAALSREYEALTAAEADLTNRLHTLLAGYPKGVPTREELDCAFSRMDKTAALEQQLQETPADRAAEELVEANRARFAQGIPADADFAAHRSDLDRLLTVNSSLETTVMTEEETKRLQKGKLLFAQGVPSEEWFAEQREKVTELTGLQHLRPSLNLPEADAAKLQGLERFFAKGVPAEETLRERNEQYTELNNLQLTRRTLELSTEDRMRLQALEHYFEVGVPQQADLEQQEQKLNRAEQLRRDNLQLSAVLPAVAEPLPAAPVKKFHSLFFPALILGILFAAAGVCLLAMPQWFAAYPPVAEQHLLFGGIGGGLGLIFLLTAVFMQNNHSLMLRLQPQAQTGGMTAAQRSLIDENERTAATLEGEVAAFLSDYPAEADRSLRSQIADLNTNRALYLPLRERARNLAKEAEENEARCKVLTALLQEFLSDFFVVLPPIDGALQAIAQKKTQYLELKARADALQAQAAENDSRSEALQEALRSSLSPYFSQLPGFEAGLRSLEGAKQTYLALLDKERDINEAAAALQKEQLTLVNRLTVFLQPYCGDVAPEGFRAALDRLRRDADSYTAAADRVSQRKEALARRDLTLAQLQADHKAFCDAYALSLSIRDRQALKQTERDAEQILRLQKELPAAADARKSFVQQHGEKPATDVKPAAYDLEGLKLAEQQLIQQQTDGNTRLLHLKQQQQNLRGETDRLPDLTDELNRCMEQKSDYTERRRLLDETVSYLQKSRESLASGYLGGVQGHFAKYLHRLTGEEAKHIAVNTDLEVQLERAGSNRALSHFSAGQTDAVHLCMRLALADALFEEGKSFMILDDPFVNLDDAHTAQALALLRELAEDRQIIYLVCNSGRI